MNRLLKDLRRQGGYILSLFKSLPSCDTGIDVDGGDQVILVSIAIGICVYGAVVASI